MLRTPVLIWNSRSNLSNSPNGAVRCDGLRILLKPGLFFRSPPTWLAVYSQVVWYNHGRRHVLLLTPVYCQPTRRSRNRLEYKPGFTLQLSASMDCLLENWPRMHWRTVGFWTCPRHARISALHRVFWLFPHKRYVQCAMTNHQMLHASRCLTLLTRGCWFPCISSPRLRKDQKSAAE